MDLAPPLSPLRPRPLSPQFSGPATQAVGQPEPLYDVVRGSRSQVAVGGRVVPAGGYPAPIRRTASFAVLPRPPVLVNVVQGVPTTPSRPRLSRRGR